MKDKSFVNIQGWMVNELKLSGDELFVYAIIHGFSQDNAGWYIGGRKYIQEWLGCGEKKVTRILSSLVEKGYIKRERVRMKGWATYRYRAIDRDLIGVKMTHIMPSNMGQNGAHINNIYIKKRKKRFTGFNELVTELLDEIKDFEFIEDEEK